MLKLLNQYPSDCTGCGACYNVCPKDAISMRPDKEGFLYPEIDNTKCVRCGKCEKICPKIQFENDNKNVPDCYAAMAEDGIRMNSSSGGVFTLAANWIIEQGGIVCGAAMEDDYTVHHICVSHKEDLGKLRKSKYVQSNTEFVYRELETYLKAGKKVLFTGCPCQVAAAKNYFRGKDEHLYLMDIFCHGVPSEKMWKDYIAENFEASEVEEIEFRNKGNGWRCDQLFVRYTDGSEIFIPRPESAYVDGFHSNLTLRKSCECCEFSDNKRPGDITVGDFWAISNYDKNLNDGKGTSAILVNNQKGEEILSAIKEKLTLCVEGPWSILKRYNRVNPVQRFSPNKNRFETLYPGKTFTDAVFSSNKGTYDVGLVGTYLYRNYGSQLVQWALYNTLTKMGYSVLLIERPNNSRKKARGIKALMFKNNPYPPYAIDKLYPNIAFMKELNNKCSAFVSGSDQVFNNNAYNDYNKFMVQNFVTDNKRKIAYAASWGHNKIWGPESDRAEQAYYMNKFDHFSVREETAVDLCKREYGMENVTWVLDPVLLCDVGEYNEMIEKSGVKTIDEPFVFSYLIKPEEKVISIIERFAEKRKLKIISATDINSKWKSAIQYVEELLIHIKNSDFVITDSFHGTCFSILFHKQFALIVKKLTGADRFTSILKMFNIDGRIIAYNAEDLENNLNNLVSINYEKVEEILNKERKRCISWLRNALESDKNLKKPYTEFNILDGRIDAIQLMYDRRIDALKSDRENDAQQYVKELNALKHDRELDALKHDRELDALKHDRELDALKHDKELDAIQRMYDSKLDALKKEIELARMSKIKKSLQYIKRKVKGGIRCYKENGAKYTVKRFFEKVINKVTKVLK